MCIAELFETKRCGEAAPSGLSSLNNDSKAERPS